MKNGLEDEAVSLRIRVSKNVVDRIDLLAGINGRQKYIRDAIQWRLDQEIPPVVLELVDEVEQLKERVGHLESAQSTSFFNRQMNETTRTKVCRDDLDRNMLSYFLQHGGATTPILAKELLNAPDKRRTIADRITKLNERAEEHLGVVVLKFHKGEKDGLRGAWWIVNAEQIVE